MQTRWTLPDQASALRWCAQRNEQGIRCILDVLGRFNRDETQARESFAAYVNVAEEVVRRGLKASLAVKPSTLGGVISRDLTMELVRGVDATPQELAAFIRAFREQSGTPSLFQQKQEEKEHE